MSYALTIKVLSCILPEGEYYVVVAKNKVDKKERNESKTATTKKGSEPHWSHAVEMYVVPLSPCTPNICSIHFETDRLCLVPPPPVLTGS